MGLLARLVSAPLAPVTGVVWLGEKLLEQAERQLDDEDAVHERLRLLNHAYDRGELDGETFEREEEALLRSLPHPDVSGRWPR